MRVIISKIFLLLLLLAVGQYSYANSSDADFSSSLTSKDSETKVNTFNHDAVTAIDFTELDLEEDYVSSDDFKDSGEQDFRIIKFNSIKQWYTIHSFVIVPNRFYRNTQNFQAFFGYAIPIYISQQVLRI